MQALILAGGEGTRLRPLTSTVPKPVVPLAGRPFIAYMLEWLVAHGVDDVILACGFMAAGVRAQLGDGSRWGARLRYVDEPRPLGTGGALRFAQDLLDERFLMLNGDVLTDIDLNQQLRQHDATGARATLALVEVQDAAAYGLVQCRSDGRVTAFVEKPGHEHSGGGTINAGVYVLERQLLDAMAMRGERFSIERDVFPMLVGDGLFGHVARGYWLDIGTPERYLKATFDILEGNVATSVLVAGDAVQIASTARVRGQTLAPAIVGAGSHVAPEAVVGGRAVLGCEVTVREGADVGASVVLDGAVIGARTTIRDSIVGPRARIGDNCRIDGAVVGEKVTIGSDNVVDAGARIFPGVAVPAGGVRA